MFVSLKGVDGLTFEDAYGMLRQIIRAEAFHMEHLAQSNKVSEGVTGISLRLLDEKDTKDDILDSLKTFSSLLYQHYGQKVYCSVDEYDVPWTGLPPLLLSGDGSVDSWLFGQALKRMKAAICGVDGLPARRRRAFWG